MSDVDATVTALQGNAVSTNSPVGYDGVVLTWDDINEWWTPRVLPTGIGGCAIDPDVDTDYTLDAVASACEWIEIQDVNHTRTATHNIVFPSSTTAVPAYRRIVFNNTLYDLVMTMSSGGSTRTLPAGYARQYWFDASGVRNAGVEFTP